MGSVYIERRRFDVLAALYEQTDRRFSVDNLKIWLKDFKGYAVARRDIDEDVEFLADMNLIEINYEYGILELKEDGGDVVEGNLIINGVARPPLRR